MSRPLPDALQSAWDNAVDSKEATEAAADALSKKEGENATIVKELDVLKSDHDSKKVGLDHNRALFETLLESYLVEGGSVAPPATPPGPAMQKAKV